MNIALKVVIGLLALLFLFLGGGLFIEPGSATEQFGLQSTNVVGLSTLRADLAGLFLASALMLGLGVLKGNTTWFLAVAVLMGFIALGRVVSLVVDGMHPAMVQALVAELVIIAVMVLADRRLGSTA